MRIRLQKLRSLGKSSRAIGASNGVRLLSHAALCVALCAGVGCGDATKTTTRANASSGNAQPSSLQLMDPKDDVMRDATASRNASSATAKPTTATSTTAKNATTASASSKGRWSVMLATFSDADHGSRANAYLAQLVREYPELSQAMVRRVGKGSAIVVGRFEGPEDKAAQAELKRVKAMERAGRKPFAGAMLLRTATDDAPAAIKPLDLRNLRAKYPKVRPLFTLQVAAWSTFGDRALDYDAMRKSSESMCAELRAKGHEAWFHHDEDSETSIVCVGHFDRRAYDSKSTLFAPEVEDLMRQFPAHLINGEPALIPVDPSKPKGKSKPQGCRLVEVPEA